MTEKGKQKLLRMTRAQLVERIEVLLNENQRTINDSSKIINNQKEYISKLHKEIDTLEVDKSRLEDVIDEDVITIATLTPKINLHVVICSVVTFVVGLFIGILF